MNKKIVYPTKGVCSQAIAIELEGDTVKSVQFVGGCISGFSCIPCGIFVWY